MLIVDEAGTVPSFITPMLVYKAGSQLAFVGDPRQLDAHTHVPELSICEMEAWTRRGGDVHRLNVSFTNCLL
jgi:hypothetical protein